MSSAFASPPPDEEYNKRVESHPDFERASQLAIWINCAGPCVIALPVLYYIVGPSIERVAPWFFPLFIAISIAILPASILLVVWFKGLVWYNYRMTVPHPSPLIGVFIGGIALTAMGMMKSFVAYGPLFLTALYPALVFWVAMLLTTKEFNKLTSLDIGNMGAMLFICYVFCLGAYTTSNTAFDRSAPHVYTSVIIEKRVVESKDNEDSFKLRLEPVPDIGDVETEVHEELFNSVEVNDAVRVNLKAGLWGARWYYISPIQNSN